MPEGDTIHRAAAKWNTAVAGQTITAVASPKLHLAQDIAGITCGSAQARGKHLLATVGPYVVHTHLGMDGRWRFATTAKPLPRASFAIATDNGLASVHQPQVLQLLDDAAVARHPDLRRLGPDLCGADEPDWDQVAAQVREYGTTHRTISTLLLDQRIGCGIGNVYRVELLFMAGINPFTRPQDVPAEDIMAMLHEARRLLRLNLTTTMRTTVADAPDGTKYVYSRNHKPCRRCRTPIKRRGQTTADRVTYWCPSCQPESPKAA